jgi:hypothetical protein
MMYKFLFQYDQTEGQKYKVFIKLSMSSTSLYLQQLIADFIPNINSKYHFIIVNCFFFILD